METNEQMSGNKQKLQQLEFSEPVCWCESKGRYTNEQGQEFQLRVRGTNVDRVREYIKAVRVSFEVLPEREEGPEEELAQAGDEKQQQLIEEELQNLELQPDLDLEINMEIVNTQGVELPYELNTIIDPPIAGGATDNYVTQTNTRRIKITLNASKQGGVVGRLNGGTPQQADTFPPDPPGDRTRFTGGSESPRQFSFSVTGLRANNKYTYSSSTRLVRV